MHNLGERVKELNCFYSISKLIEQGNVSLEEIVQGIVNLIPPSLRYPQITCARIILEDQEFRTGNFKETAWKQASDITMNNERIGTLEVYCLEEKLGRGEDSFLKEARYLIEAIAERIGKVTERKVAKKKLKEREKELEIKSSNLEEINTALKVLLQKRDEDKIELEDRILSNVKELVEPYLIKLKNTRLDEKQNAYVSILESNLKEIISPFSQRLSSKYFNLTPTEIQVAGLVKEGRTAKEIAELLNKSIRAIEFHKNNIRKKLGLINKKANLRSHLLSLK
jgi:DNA-binding CsgD family transcriptional regulator